MGAGQDGGGGQAEGGPASQVILAWVSAVSIVLLMSQMRKLKGTGFLSSSFPPGFATVCSVGDQECFPTAGVGS